jgi:hypothetical protein
VLGAHAYTGPYRLDDMERNASKAVGWIHGTIWGGQHGCPNGWEAYLVAQNRAAIARADLVFAYINTPDCYGTLLDLGYAQGLGKFTAAVVDSAGCHIAPPRCQGDGWPLSYAMHAADYGGYAASHPAPTSDWNDLRAEVTSTGIRVVLPEPEACVDIVCELQKALAAYTATLPATATVAPGVRQSFRNIAQWTSDPRVRAEAQRMLTRLEATP